MKIKETLNDEVRKPRTKVAWKRYRRKITEKKKSFCFQQNLERNVSVGECKGRPKNKEMESQWQLLCPRSFFLLTEGSGAALLWLTVSFIDPQLFSFSSRIVNFSASTT